MNVYIDAEFTGLSQYAQLISLALISDDGCYFYAEFEVYKEPTQWVKENVLPYLLNECSMTLYEGEEQIYFTKDRWEIRNQLEIWLLQWNDIQIIGDTLFLDWLLFVELFDWDLPKNIFYMPFDIVPLFYLLDIDPDINRVEFSGFPTNRLTIFGESFNKHNALHDAFILKLNYHKLMHLLEKK